MSANGSHGTGSRQAIIFLSATLHPPRMRLRIHALLLPVLAALPACDPCTGIAACSNGQYLSANGQIVDHGSGRGIDGVRLDVVRVGGIAVANDSIRTVTADGGFWRAEFEPVSRGTLFVDVEVAPPNESAYRVRGVQLETREHGGDATLNQRWVSRPYFNKFGVFHLRSSGAPVGNTRVEFRRTGGVELRGPGIASGVYARVTDAGGYFRMFPYADADTVLPTGNDAVVGDLTLYLAPPYGTSVIHGVSIPPVHQFGIDDFAYEFAVGPSLGYLGSVRDSAAGALIPGVQLDFQRTGGIPVSPSAFTTFTGPDGIFGLPPVRALAAGTLDGRFIIRVSPAASPETLLVHIPTTDVDVDTLPPYVVGAGGAVTVGSRP